MAGVWDDDEDEPGALTPSRAFTAASSSDDDSDSDSSSELFTKRAPAAAPAPESAAASAATSSAGVSVASSASSEIGEIPAVPSVLPTTSSPDEFDDELVANHGSKGGGSSSASSPAVAAASPAIVEDEDEPGDLRIGPTDEAFDSDDDEDEPGVIASPTTSPSPVKMDLDDDPSMRSESIAGTIEDEHTDVVLEEADEDEAMADPAEEEILEETEAEEEVVEEYDEEGTEESVEEEEEEEPMMLQEMLEGGDQEYSEAEVEEETVEESYEEPIVDKAPLLGVDDAEVEEEEEELIEEEEEEFVEQVAEEEEEEEYVDEDEEEEAPVVGDNDGAAAAAVAGYSDDFFDDDDDDVQGDLAARAQTSPVPETVLEDVAEEDEEEEEEDPRGSGEGSPNISKEEKQQIIDQIFEDEDTPEGMVSAANGTTPEKQYDSDDDEEDRALLGHEGPRQGPRHTTHHVAEEQQRLLIGDQRMFAVEETKEEVEEADARHLEHQAAAIAGLAAPAPSPQETAAAAAAHHGSFTRKYKSRPAPPPQRQQAPLASSSIASPTTGGVRAGGESSTVTFQEPPVAASAQQQQSIQLPHPPGAAKQQPSAADPPLEPQKQQYQAQAIQLPPRPRPQQQQQVPPQQYYSQQPGPEPPIPEQLRSGDPPPTPPYVSNQPPPPGHYRQTQSTRVEHGQYYISGRPPPSVPPAAPYDEAHLANSGGKYGSDPPPSRQQQPHTTAGRAATPPPKKPKKKRRPKVKPCGFWDYMLIFLIILVVVALAVALPLIFLGRSRNLQTPAPVTPRPTNQPTETPVSVPTATPTVVKQRFVLAGGPFATTSGTLLGISTAVDGGLAAAGAPGGGNGGAVATYIYFANPGGTAMWVPGPELIGGQYNDAFNQDSGLFGTSVDVKSGNLLVGSPGVFAPETITASGAVFAYTYNETSGQFLPLGEELRGDDKLNQGFGSAVAMSRPGSEDDDDDEGIRVVIGASQYDQGNGAVYTFEYNNATQMWTPMSPGEPYMVPSLEAGAQLGSVVAMSARGNRFLAGAPLAPANLSGRVFLYEWSETSMSWSLEYEVVGSENEQMGSSLEFLTDDGSVFAVGAPGALKEGSLFPSGKVVVYRRAAGGQRHNLLRRDRHDRDLQSGDAYTPLPGGPIYGTEGDSYGFSIAGGLDPASGALSILIGTSDGRVQHLVYDESAQAWIKPFDVVNTGKSGQVTSLSASPDSGANSFVAGVASANEVTFYHAPAEPTFGPTVQTTAAPGTVTPTSLPSAPVPPSTIAPIVLPPSSTLSPTILPTATVSQAPTPATPAPSTPPTIQPTPDPTPLDPTFTPSVSPPPSTQPSGRPTPASALKWTLVAGPFTGPFNLGVSVALSRAVMAAGDSLGKGLVQTYRKEEDGTFTPIGNLLGTQNASQFGRAIYLSLDSSNLLVGAPGTVAEGTATATGAAYFYRSVKDATGWKQRGSEIRGDDDIFAANEAFGFSVAQSENNVLAIGAPWSHAENMPQRGRVYTFRFNETTGDWQFRSPTVQLLGLESQDLLGSAVDISKDGSTLLAGAPGHNDGAGYAQVFTWNGTAWNEPMVIEDSTTMERLGTSVRILTDDGSLCAVGGPGFDGGRGVIRVYQYLAVAGEYVQLGPPIEGAEVGDELGQVNSLSGSESVILASTANGDMHTFGYDAATDSWNSVVQTVEQPEFRTTPAISGSGRVLEFVAGSLNQVFVYSLLQ